MIKEVGTVYRLNKNSSLGIDIGARQMNWNSSWNVRRWSQSKICMAEFVTQCGASGKYIYHKPDS